MKRISLILCSLVISATLFAQKANIQSASNYLKESDFENAKKMIDEATSSESTKENAKAWLLKAVVYEAISIPSDMIPQFQFILNEVPYMLDLSKASALRKANPNALGVAVESFKKYMTLNPKYEKSELMPLLDMLMRIPFNEGVNAINANKMTDARNNFAIVNDIAGMDGGKFWKDVNEVKESFATAKMYQGYADYQLGNMDAALPVFEEVINGPAPKEDIFVWALEIYEAKRNNAKWEETMAKGKAKFPKSAKLTKAEINYYKSTGKTDVFIEKLKQGIALEPNNEYLHIYLGEALYGMAYPQDDKNKPLPKPANSKDLMKEAEKALNKAIELNPNNVYSQSTMGIMFFNDAKDMTDVMNKENDDKKYNAMKIERDAILNKAVPFFEKVKDIIAKDGVNDSNKDVYKVSLNGLMQAFNILNKTEKAAEINAILKGIK